MDKPASVRLVVAALVNVPMRVLLNVTPGVVDRYTSYRLKALPSVLAVQFRSTVLRCGVRPASATGAGTSSITTLSTQMSESGAPPAFSRVSKRSRMVWLTYADNDTCSRTHVLSLL